MLRTVVIFGLISGAVIAGLTAVMLPLCLNGTIRFENSQLLGYSTMLLSFLAVFFVPLFFKLIIDRKLTTTPEEMQAPVESGS